MDDEKQSYTPGAQTSPHGDHGPATALSRVISAPEQDRGQSSWRSPDNHPQSPASWRSGEDSLVATPRWAATSSALDTLVEAAERPEKRIRLDDYHPSVVQKPDLRGQAASVSNVRCMRHCHEDVPDHCVPTRDVAISDTKARHRILGLSKRTKATMHLNAVTTVGIVINH